VKKVFQGTSFAQKSICLLLLGACERELASNVNPDRVHTEYTANYSEDSRQLEVRATFFFGGSTGTYLELDGGSRITLNGSAMYAESTFLDQLYYERQENGVSADNLVPRNFQLSYTDTAGRVYANAFSFGRPPRMTLSRDNVRREIVIAWESDEEISTDEIFLSYWGSSGGGSSSFSGPARARSGESRIAEDSWYSAGAHSVKFRICRSKRASNLEAPQAGGNLDATWCGLSSSL
jgi:hypothetical protein